ncbi:MAG TPA: arginine--tRNA ligase [Acidimicrobiia bacterium]|nr:arginine--tRNA ligase [Acidimicrobiia bacterium]
MSLLSDLSTLFSEAFSGVGLDPALGEVVPSQRPELAQFQCNGAMAGAKQAGRNPRDIAAEVVATVGGDPRIASLDIAGPGFINITVTDAALTEAVESMRSDDRLGVAPPAEKRKVIVDHGGPNVAKSLHVGHLRPAIIGQALKRIMAFAGYDALGDVHLGDWGTPMGQLIAELERRNPDWNYFDAAYEGPYASDSPVTVDELEELYPTASQRAKDDPDFADAARRATFELQDGRPGYRALWGHFRRVSVESMRAIYDELGVTFELWLGEASVHERIAPMIERMRATGAVTESQGALIVEVSHPDDKTEIPPLMLVKSDGAYTYGTTDVATIDERAEAGTDEVIYVVDQRQSLHFEQVFRAARRGGVAPAGMLLEHTGFGTVNGADGKPMRTRDGNLPRLHDLVGDVVRRAGERMDERDLARDHPVDERARIAWMVGVAALKFGDLSNHRASNYVFDLDRFTSFEGKTGPYLLYASVRIGSILRRTEQEQIGPVSRLTGQPDRALALLLTRFPEVVDRTIALRAPNHLAEYCYELSQVFNRFYEECHILSEPDPELRASWLAVAELTRQTLVTGLDLLGIDVPDRM